MKEKLYLGTACLILAAALLLRFTPAAQAQHPVSAEGAGTFMLVAHSNNNAQVGIFRIDTTTGAVSYCYINGTVNASIVCTPPVQ